MDIAIYLEKTDDDGLISFHENCTIKPCKGDSLLIGKKYYMVEMVTIDYGKNIVYVAVSQA